jgi:hypothetical protein
MNGGPTSGNIVDHDRGEPRWSALIQSSPTVSFDGLAWKNQPHFALC